MRSQSGTQAASQEVVLRIQEEVGQQVRELEAMRAATSKLSKGGRVVAEEKGMGE